MRFDRMRGVLAGSAVVMALAVTASASASTETVRSKPGGDAALEQAVSKVTRSTPWTLAERIRLGFDTYHPQGFARVGDKLFMSSVEVLEAPVRYPAPVDGYDRSPGRGRGHVFVMDLRGNLLRDIVLGEGHMYHPGGIDTDGKSLWVPVAEYRPYSHAIVYRVDLRTLAVHEEFRVADHVGGVVTEPGTGRVYGVTWGSREFYSWNSRGRELSHTVNHSHFIDYQDCAYASRRMMLCTGVTNYPTGTGTSLELGGIALLDVRSNDIRHEVPVQLRSTAGHVATRNPVHLEAAGGVLRMFAAPDDAGEGGGTGTEILVYEARVG
ncbi:DUF6454 family protein [Streptomycetaceae bacterium NBC_01309]